MWVVVVDIGPDEPVLQVYGPFPSEEEADKWARSADVTAANLYWLHKVQPV